MPAVIDRWPVTEVAEVAPQPAGEVGVDAMAFVMVEIEEDWMQRSYVCIPEIDQAEVSDDEWASEDILTPEVLAEFHRASEQLLARRSQ